MLFGPAASAFDWPGGGAQLRQALQSPDVERRSAGVRSLAHKEREAALRGLAGATRDAKVPVRRLAFHVLADLGAPLPAELIRQGLADSAAAVREAAVRALSVSGLQETGAWLARAYGDGEVSVRLAVIRALADAPVEGGESILLMALADAHGPAVEAALLALARRGTEASLPALNERALGKRGGHRRYALRALAACGGTRVGDVLLASLQSEDENLRAEAARGLGRVGYGEGVDALIARLGDSSVPVVWAAAEALGALGDARAAPGLGQLLAKGPARRAAAESLLALGEAAKPVLESVLRFEEEGEAVAEAAWVLSRLAGPAAVTPLLDASRRGQLGGLALIVALETLPGAEATDAILALLEVPLPEVRGRAAVALTRRSDRRAEDLLAHHYASFPPGARLSVLAWLAAHGSGQGAEVVAQALRSGSSQEQRVALQSLGASAAVNLRELVLPLLGSEHRSLRYAAGAALARLGDRQLLSELLQGAAGWGRGSQPDVDALLMTVSELARRSGDPRVRPLLKRLSTHASPGVREAAIEGLALVGGREDLDDLLRVREALGWGALRALSAALAALGEPGDLQLLMELLEHPDDAVAASAAWGLGRLGIREAAASLQRVAADRGKPAASTNARMALEWFDGGASPVGESWTALQILGPAGEPMAGREVRFSLQNGATLAAYTGRSGVARLVGLLPGAVSARPHELGAPVEEDLRRRDAGR